MHTINGGSHPVGSAEWLLEVWQGMRDHETKILALEAEVHALRALINPTRPMTSSTSGGQ